MPTRWSEDDNPEVIEVPVYHPPLISSTYDPDGLQELLAQDEIDWDDQSVRELLPLVMIAADAGPQWGDMTGDDRSLWIKDNADVLAQAGYDTGGPMHNIGGVISADSDIGEYYDQTRTQGTVGGDNEINWEYYSKDPMWITAFANLGIDATEGLTDANTEDLFTAYQGIYETNKAIMNDQYRMPWDAELPGKWKPVEMETDYETPFDMPGIVQGLPEPSMSPSLQVRDMSQFDPAGNFARQRSSMTTQFKALQANTPNQTGFVPKIPETSTAAPEVGEDPEVVEDTVNPYEHIDISNLQFQDKYVMKTAGELGLDNADLAKRWAVVAGVGNLNQDSDIRTMKTKYEQLDGKLPKTSI